MATMAERIAAMKAEADAAEAKVNTPEFIAAEEDRKALATHAERLRAAQERARAKAVDDRLDACHARLGDSVALEAVTIAEYPDFFIVRAAGGKAHAAWLQGQRDVAMGTLRRGTREKVKPEDVSREYVFSGIVEWNGEAIDNEEGDAGSRLSSFLKVNSAIVGQLYEAISRLDGAASEARKR